MKWPRFLLCVALLCCCAMGTVAAPPKDKNAAPKLTITKLAPAKLVPNLCLLKYPITTSSPQCQAYFDQGLGYFYSYVWMEAARSFETATKHDPNCAMAWWGLSRAIERWGRGGQNDALKKAQELLPRTSHREKLLITARLQEKGMWPGVGPDQRQKKAVETIDTLLALYDDEEGWYYRAQLAGGWGPSGGGAAGPAPFYKALLRINPLHPGANHELVHFYENFRRPALGMPYAEMYIKSSPGIPHAWHMQAHLATRIGRWDKTVDRSSQAIVLHRAYHKDQEVRPGDDAQFSHHLETLMRGLIHDGRFEEARALKKECEGYNIFHRELWFHLHLAERNWDDALAVARHFEKNDKLLSGYMRALVFLKKGETDRAVPEVAVLQEAYQRKKNDKRLEARLWEVQGILLCQQPGGSGPGLKLLAKLVERTKGDYFHHSWGNGASHMEAWGIAALQARRHEVAEEAFLEALAHDAGSFRGALGLQILCERQGRSEEAARYSELAERCWRNAASQSLQNELSALRQVYPHAASTALNELTQPTIPARR
jgi:tetratricopeptide (TPR) repeat protein